MCADFAKKLEAIKSKNRYRSLSLPGGIDLSSNDYLGLKDHPSLRRAAIEALQDGMSVGSGGSRLLRGHCEEHARLEEFAAKHYGFERALYFANGYSANYALLTALPARRDIVLFDSLVHASMRDGLYTPSITSQKISHNDLDAYEAALKKHSGHDKRVFIAVESVYSMDGDFAPLAELHALALRYDAVLIVDEAHSTGVYGDHGKGLADALPRENLITVHTCGKALGVAGGLVCASNDIIEYLINTARPFIYSTAPPPLQAYLTMKAIELCAGAEGDAARAKLMKLCTLVKERIGGYGSQIVPIVLGADEKAVAAANRLQSQDYDIRAVRPPTVPEGSARLRLSINAGLSAETLNAFLDDLAKLNALPA